MSVLKQLFGITTTRRNRPVQKLARSNHKTLVTAMNYEKGEVHADDFFDYIIAYNDVKKFLKISINTEEPVHILLIGPPASAKTMFIKSMMMILDNSYFTDGGNSTKTGMLELTKCRLKIRYFC